jgi:hypothetical protein
MHLPRLAGHVDSPALTASTDVLPALVWLRTELLRSNSMFSDNHTCTDRSQQLGCLCHHPSLNRVG